MSYGKKRLKLTDEDKLWADSVKKRDGGCVICGATYRLNAHHLIPREVKETKYDIDNGLSLCPKHHMFSRKVSAHNNPLSIVLWLMKNRKWQLDYVLKRLEEIGIDDST
jgi:predicted restriction endonuclease